MTKVKGTETDILLLVGIDLTLIQNKSIEDIVIIHKWNKFALRSKDTFLTFEDSSRM
jgi:hypothetical protein